MLAVYRKLAVLYTNVLVHVQQVCYKYELSTNPKLPRKPPLEKKKNLAVYTDRTTFQKLPRGNFIRPLFYDVPIFFDRYFNMPLFVFTTIF